MHNTKATAMPASPPPRIGPAAMMTLQNVILPEAGLCTETALYYHGSGALGFSAAQRRLTLGPGAALRFDSYFNALSIGKWHGHCHLSGLFLGLLGRGLVELRVVLALPERSWEVLHCDLLRLDPAQEQVLDLSHYRDHGGQGVLFFELRALEPQETVSFHAARFMTRARPGPGPELAICITTYRREAAVARTVARLQAFIARFDHGARLQLFVVDNGARLDLPAAPGLRCLPNRNLGGAGGFARGLAEAEAAGASHCLFMDDDAAFAVENIARTYAFLALARQDSTALAGAMIDNSHKWRMWENGALFDRRCQPLFNGTDLRDTGQIIAMEFASHTAPPPNLYGGWWYFAFPLARVRHRPFPFFVRGDDISFSLANRFAIVTLNGLAAFQDDFSEKESPLTLYLDLRSHLVHHLVFPMLDRGRTGTAGVALRFVLRSLARFHYETAEAQLLAWRDVLQGPRFFAENPDMAARRQRIAGLVRNEAWQTLDTPAPPAAPHRPGRGAVSARLFAWSLNGHLLPFFGRWGAHVVLTAGQRGQMHPAWGAARITYVSTARDRSYTVRIAPRRGLALALRAGALGLRFIWRYKALRTAYRAAYPHLTGQDFWDGQAGTGPVAEKRPEPAPVRRAG